MHIYFVENENPARNSSSGHMTYILNLTHYLTNTGIKSTLIGSGNTPDYQDIGDKNPVKNFVSLYEGKISNSKYFLKLFRINKRLKGAESSVFHLQSRIISGFITLENRSYLTQRTI